MAKPHSKEKSVHEGHFQTRICLWENVFTEYKEMLRPFRARLEGKTGLLYTESHYTQRHVSLQKRVDPLSSITAP